MNATHKQPSADTLFKQHFNDAHVVTSRYVALATFLVLALFAWWDLDSLGLNHPQLNEVLFIRFSFTTPIILLTFIYSFKTKPSISQDLLVTLSCLITSMTIVALHWKFFSLGKTLEINSIMLCLVAVYFLPNIFSIQKLIIGITLIFSYFVYLYYTKHDASYYIHSGIYLSSINIAGLIHSINFDKQRRIIFDKTEFLKQLALTDQLTGAENRHKFDENFIELLKQARQENKSIAIAIADIDYFKQYNDSYGHLSGDECLIKVAHTFLNMKKHPLDRCIRFGGEEFILIKYDVTSDDSEAWGESIIQAVYQLNIPHKSSSIESRVTTSAGLIHWDPSSNLTRTELMRRADEALYKAKDNGRNQIMISYEA